MTIRRCRRCLTLDSRPRVEFNKAGVCNACEHSEEKTKIDWKARWDKLQKLCDKHRKKDTWDVIAPVSGGKDSSYVAWKLKHELDMNPLCVHFAPPMPTDIGKQNLENFKESGFDIVEIHPNPAVYKNLCKKMFIEQARSKFPFVIGIGTAISQVALGFGIPLIIWGEQGEEEYSGDTKHKSDFMTFDFARNIYHEGNDLSEYGKWWELPTKKDFETLTSTWWSKYEAWDDALHRDFAIEKCGLRGAAQQTGTFTTHSQVDDYLQDLFMFECFIKFGFGRATADCNLAIKAGRMTRDEGLEIVEEIDGEFPLQFFDRYLQFFDMDEDEFWGVIGDHVNYDLLQPTGDKKRPYELCRIP